MKTLEQELKDARDGFFNSVAYGGKESGIICKEHYKRIMKKYYDRSQYRMKQLRGDDWNGLQNG